MPDLPRNLPVYTVSKVLQAISNHINQVANEKAYLIEGELTNVHRSPSGHYYLDLKDDEGQMHCTLWRSRADALDFQLQNGQKVVVQGEVTVYPKRGDMQISIRNVWLSGIGMLYEKYRQLQARLQAEGWFNPQHKKPFPPVIGRVAIVTGDGTAALEDMLKTIRSRWPMLEVTLFPTPVQGESAPARIIQSLQEADQGGFDAIILARGGGSFEDLFCFNDEDLVKTLYNLNTFVITGIGHETDTTLADLAADVRALTPTDAATKITQDQRIVRQRLQELGQTMNQAVASRFDRAASRLIDLTASSLLYHPDQYVRRHRERFARNVSELDNRARLIEQQHANQWMQQSLLLNQTMLGYGQYQRNRLDKARSNLDMLSPRELVEFSKNRLMQNTAQLSYGVQNLWREQSARLDKARSNLAISSPYPWLRQEQQQLSSLDGQLNTGAANILRTSRLHWQQLSSMLEALSWQNTLNRGFSVVFAGGKPVKAAGQLSLGEPVTITFASGQAGAQIQAVYPNGKHHQ